MGNAHSDHGESQSSQSNGKKETMGDALPYSPGEARVHAVDEIYGVNRLSEAGEKCDIRMDGRREVNTEIYSGGGMPKSV